MAIKDTPKGQPDSALDFPRVVDDVGQEYDPTEPIIDVVSYMENKYPEMTKEFRTIQKEQYELFLHKQHDYGPQNVAVGSLLKTKEDQEMVDTQDVVKYMERTYPEMTGEFLKIQSEQYELFCRKQYDYGSQNIAVGTILKTPEDIKLSLLGLWFRMNDKIERMKTLLLRNGVNSVEGEPVTDSFSDVSNYGVMAQVVARGKWAK